MANSITVGSWNMLNAFGDESRLRGALETIKQIDADILYIGEMMVKASNCPVYKEAVATLSSLGYEKSEVSGYAAETGARDGQFMSMWSRIYGHINTMKIGSRRGLKAVPLAFDWAVYGIHTVDNDEAERQRSAAEVLKNWSLCGSVPAIVMGDFNAMHRRDPKSRLPRATQPIMEHLAPEDPSDYYDKSKKIRRAVGIGVRVCSMADGGTMAMFEQAGFCDADPNYQPTVHVGPIGFQIDHILSGGGAHLEDFTVHSRKAPDGRPLSDHNPLTARAHFS